MNTRQQVGLFFALFFAYLVLGGREPPWNDARQIYQVAESLVERGAIDVEARTFVVRDGKYYAAHPFLSSAVHLPGAVLAKVTTKLWPGPDREKLVTPLASHLGPAALAALVGLLFFRLCLTLGSSLPAARFGTLTLAFATMVAVYARSPYSEITQTAAYLAFYVALYAWLERPSLRRALVFGLLAGALCNTKVIFLLALPGAALLAALRLGRAAGPRVWLKHAGMAALGGLPGLILLFGYNYARSRAWLATGYPAEQISGREFGEWTGIGLWGLFFSLGKSLFLFSPPLIVAALALPHALRSRSRLWLATFVATAGPVLVFYGRFTFWHGDWCWGPRYGLFLLPVALLPLVFLYDDLRLSRRSLANLGAAGVFALGFSVQVLGGLFYWDHYIRVAREAQSQWLGAANRSGATTPDTGADCGPCIEDVYGLNWLPAFQPIEGHLWLLRSRIRGLAWPEAEAAAPWHRYTSLKLNIASSYGRARIDWWLIDWRGRHRTAGAALFALFFLGLATGATVALRRPGERRAFLERSRPWFASAPSRGS